MATIGLYHLDLWHGQKAVPNLELIKIYSYFINKGDQVLMVGPQDELTRFNYIYFFKDSQKPLGKLASSKIDFPNKKLIGYGFFGMTEKLKPEVFNQKLNYDCYNSVSYKLTNKTDYINMFKNSLIRVETQDFTDYKKDSKTIYISDNNPTAIAEMPSFLLEHRNHNFKPLHSFIVNSNNIDTFARFENLILMPLKCNDYDSNTYKEYCMDNHIIFNYEQRKQETENHYIARLLAMGIIIKYYQAVPKIGLSQIKLNGIASSVYQWILQKQWDSFATYYQNDNNIQNYILSAPSEIRLLSKTRPIAINPSTFDLKSFF